MPSDLMLTVTLWIFMLAAAYFWVLFCLTVWKRSHPALKAALIIIPLVILEMGILYAFMALLGPWGVLRN
jgi:hypothetical protein